MPKLNLKPTEQIPTTALRRSPRFLQSNHPQQENPVTRKSVPRKIWVPNSCSTPTSSSLHSGSNKTQKVRASKRRRESDTVSKGSKKLSNGPRRCTRSGMRNNREVVDLGKQCLIERRLPRRSQEEVPKKETVMALKRLENSSNRSRSYTRSDSRADAKKNRQDTNSGKKHVIERRITRSLTRENRNASNKVTNCNPMDDCSKGVRVRALSDKEKAELGVNLSVEFECNGDNRVASSGNRVTFSEHVDSTKCFDKEKGKGLRKQSIRKSDENEGNLCKGKTLIGENRGRSRIEEEGWTEEQELALQRAYFTVKPTPHFWKKVAWMVPGKSAKECFDRIQSENLTPSQPQPRSRARKKNESPLSLSASKLLNSVEVKIRKARSNKRKSLVAQKTVRHLLEKQKNVDQDYEADLFEILEPTTSSSPLFPKSTTFSTPEQSNKGLSFLKKCHEKSSSAQKKQPSRLQSSCNAAFASPPVLKQIKNKALHEKYIDKLHCREAKRKAASLKNGKCTKSKNDENKSHLEKGNAIKAAKDALIFDTQDAINKLLSDQSSKRNVDDIEDDCFRSDEDEGEDEFL